jgi:aryl-alcohol dehydrogenase-like predicted oxidoreductase
MGSFALSRAKGAFEAVDVQTPKPFCRITMRYNKMGNTELRLSEFSFGAGTAAGLMVHGSVDEQVATVRAALDAGINHFDTAAHYGHGASEIYLGQALRLAGAKDVLITSKVAIGREFVEAAAFRRCVRQSVEQSLQRLRRDVIDVLLIHNATHAAHVPYTADREGERIAEIMNAYIPGVTFDDIMGDRGVFEEVEALVREGKVRFFGLSGQDNDPQVIKKLIATGKISVFNQTFNLLNPSAGYPQARGGRALVSDFARCQRELFIEFADVIEDARAANVGVSVISPLAAGTLTDSAERGEPPPKVSLRSNRFPLAGQYDRQLALARQFKPIAEREGMTLTELALRFVQSTPGVTTTVIGISNLEQLRDIVRQADKPPLCEEVLGALRKIWLGSGVASATAN